MVISRAEGAPEGNAERLRANVRFGSEADGDGVCGVEHAFVDGVVHLECFHHRTGGQVVDLQPATRHRVDARGIVLSELVPDVGRAPGALHLQGDRFRMSAPSHKRT